MTGSTITKLVIGLFTAVVAVSSAEAALQVYDYRDNILAPRVEYFAYDQTMIALNVKTGDFQYVYEVGHIADGVNEVERYNQDGFVDNNLIPEAELTDDMVWFAHRDVKVPGAATGDAVLFETPTGGAGGQLDADGAIYNPARVPGSNPNTWVAHDWYWADQDLPGGTAALPYPTDGASAGTVDGTLSYNNDSATGYTGALTSGFGGWGHANGWPFGVSPSTATVAFQLEEADGTHYGWVAFRHNGDRVHQWIHGWAYQTTPFVAAELTWDSSSEPGDFDGDGDVDADDIDILCANMGGDLDPYDLDGDSDVDEDDMVFLVETLVEYDSDGDGTADGTGTYQGDFNLDGLVNATDLQIMKGGFGATGGYADGNANCDTVVNATDLQILKTHFGLTAAAVPEPLTVGLLGLGTLGLLRRRAEA